MNKNFLNKSNSFLIIIFFGFFLSLTLSTYYVLKYDKYLFDNETNQLIKDETKYHWVAGAKIAKDVREGKNFFISGGVTYTKPLQQRIVGLYSLITGYKLVDSWEPKPKVSLEGKLPYLIIQSLFYFFSLYYFSKRLKNIIPNRAFLFAILFLSIEPTILQYHSSFYTESIYFSLLLLIFGMLLEKKINFSYNLIIGILIGLAFLQRSGAVYYIVPVLICYVFLFKKKIVYPFLGILSGFVLICFLIGMYNQHKTGKFYFYPPEGKWGMYSYFSVYVLADKLNVSGDEARMIELKKTLKWAKENNIEFKKDPNFEKINSPMKLIGNFSNEIDQIKFYDYIHQRQYKILLESPFITLKKTIQNTMHLIVLNPTFVHYYNTYRGVIKGSVEFSQSQIHKNWIPFRISYTLFIYIFCLIGFIELYKKKKLYEFYLITFSVLYYLIIYGWYGKTRLHVPSLIYLSVFFGVGIDLFLNKFIKYKKLI